jgi:hypothetical protein
MSLKLGELLKAGGKEYNSLRSDRYSFPPWRSSPSLSVMRNLSNTKKLQAYQDTAERLYCFFLHAFALLPLNKLSFFSGCYKMGITIIGSLKSNMKGN